MSNTTDTTKRYRLKKDYVTPRFTYAKGADVSYLGGMYVIGIETFTEEALKTTPEWFEEVLPVSEPVKERIEISSFNTLSRFTPVGKVIQVLEVVTDKKITGDRFPAIKQAIESCLNEPLPQPPSALNDTVEDSKIKELESLLEYYQAEFNANQDKVYTQAEVDAIRADEFAKGYYSAKEQVTDCLNLNTNDTGKEETGGLKTGIMSQMDMYNMGYKDGVKYAQFIKPEQPTNDNAFVWDDQLVGEFACDLRNNREKYEKEYKSWRDSMGEFKERVQQSKQSEPTPQPPLFKEQGWEIMKFTFRHRNGEVIEISSEPATKYYRDVIEEYPDAVIKSVLRKSDNVIFSVGDSVCLNWYPPFDVVQPIKRIEIENGNIYLYYDKTAKYELQFARINPKHKNQ